MNNLHSFPPWEKVVENLWIMKPGRVTYPNFDSTKYSYIICIVSSVDKAIEDCINDSEDQGFMVEPFDDNPAS